MNRFEPKSIKALDANTYDVSMLIDGSLSTHQFTFHTNRLNTRVLEQEDRFYIKTSDVPETEWLERAIYSFDEARTAALASELPEPLSLCNKGPGSYELGFANGTTAQIEVVENKALRTATWSQGSCEAKLDQYGSWKTSADANPLLAGVLMLHQAINPKYKVEPAGQV
jgi:hypothetical protein